MSQQCIDPIVGKILAGWRYDISGLALEMRGDYENHFAGCEHCRSHQQIHRIIDVGLIALASISAAVFLLAFGVIWHLGPRHAFWLEIAALTGFGCDLVGRGRGYPRPGDGSRCGQTGRKTRSRPVTRGDPPAAPRRTPHQNYRNLDAKRVPQQI